MCSLKQISIIYISILALNLWTLHKIVVSHRTVTIDKLSMADAMKENNGNLKSLHNGTEIFGGNY